MWRSVDSKTQRQLWDMSEVDREGKRMWDLARFSAANNRNQLANINRQLICYKDLGSSQTYVTRLRL